MRIRENTVVYLGRNPEYTIIAGNDKENHVIYFNLDDTIWDNLVSIHTESGMWILNEAFMEVVYKHSKGSLATKDYWQVRLTTDPSKYPAVLSIDQPGAYYSRELNFLRTHSYVITYTGVFWIAV